MGESAAPKVIGFLSPLLERVAEWNDRLRSHPMTTAFHGVRMPAISIRSYLERIFRYANCSDTCFLVAYIYLHRLAQIQPIIGAVDSLNIHRLLITAVLLAAKFMDDIYYNNAYYAKIGGISTKEMNFLEVEFLFGLGFRLNVTPTTFHGYNGYLHRQMQLIHPTLIINTAPKMIHHRHQSCFTTSNSVVDHQDEASNPASHQHQLAV